MVEQTIQLVYASARLNTHSQIK